MPAKSLSYQQVKFSPEAIGAGTKEFWDIGARRRARPTRKPSAMAVRMGEVEWTYDREQDFFADYFKESCTYAHWQATARVPVGLGTRSCSLEVTYKQSGGRCETLASVDLPDRTSVEEVFAVFEQFRAECTTREAPTVFIGHGRSAQWGLLERHLRDLHHLNVVSFESAPRAGRSVKEVLKELQGQASFAILVHTAEDTLEGGEQAARDNVIHETGLFQDKLGWERAIILREDGCVPFSNIAGVIEIRYPAGAIRETFGDVVATIRREFPTALDK